MLQVLLTKRDPTLSSQKKVLDSVPEWDICPSHPSWAERIQRIMKLDPWPATMGTYQHLRVTLRWHQLLCTPEITELGTALFLGVGVGVEQEELALKALFFQLAISTDSAWWMPKLLSWRPGSGQQCHPNTCVWPLQTKGPGKALLFLWSLLRYPRPGSAARMEGKVFSPKSLCTQTGRIIWVVPICNMPEFSLTYCAARRRCPSRCATV